MRCFLFDVCNVDLFHECSPLLKSFFFLILFIKNRSDFFLLYKSRFSYLQNGSNFFFTYKPKTFFFFFYFASKQILYFFSKKPCSFHLTKTDLIFFTILFFSYKKLTWFLFNESNQKNLFTKT